MRSIITVTSFKGRCFPQPSSSCLWDQKSSRVDIFTFVGTRKRIRRKKGTRGRGLIKFRGFLPCRGVSGRCIFWFCNENPYTANIRRVYLLLELHTRFVSCRRQRQSNSFETLTLFSNPNKKKYQIVLMYTLICVKDTSYNLYIVFNYKERLCARSFYWRVIRLVDRVFYTSVVCSSSSAHICVAYPWI